MVFDCIDLAQTIQHRSIKVAFLSIAIWLGHLSLTFGFTLSVQSRVNTAVVEKSGAALAILFPIFAVPFV